MKLLMLLIFFLLIGAFFIISNENIRMNSQENVDRFFDLYGEWIDSLTSNSQVVVGHVVKMEWLPNEGRVSR